MSKIFDSIEVSQDVKNFVDNSFAISNKILSVLDAKKMTQKDLALLMGKKESEISKWLTGMHNFTLKSIAKIEAALEEKLLYLPDQIKQPRLTKFVPVVVTKIVNIKENHLNYTKRENLEEGKKPNLISEGIEAA